MKPPQRLWPELLTEFLAFSLLTASVALLWRSNLLLFTVALAECLLAVALWHDRLSVSFFLTIAALGTLAEAMFVHFGIWHYANPTFLGIPLWFPVAFGTTGLIGARLARTVAAMWEKVSPSWRRIIPSSPGCTRNESQPSRRLGACGRVQGGQKK
jgi:hypothetical protein